MVKNPLKRKKKKNPFEASLLVDNPDIKVVEARFDEKPFLIAVGKSEQREKKVVGEVGLPKIGKGEYGTQKDMKWQVMYNPNSLPSGFMSEERFRNWAGGTVYLTSSSDAVYSGHTQYIETDERIGKIMQEVQRTLNYLDVLEQSENNRDLIGEEMKQLDNALDNALAKPEDREDEKKPKKKKKPKSK